VTKVVIPFVCKQGRDKFVNPVGAHQSRENGCSWDKDTCSEAARGGHLVILKKVGKRAWVCLE